MEENPFLHGISWTSAMEFAIRSINWMVALAFIAKANDNDNDNENLLKLSEKLQNGIINITYYLTKHYSRFSSANNHLLVEATAIGLAGYAFGHRPWQELAIRILTEEIEKQNYSDGVNKELSLHYQTFGMEAYLLMAHAMQRNSGNHELRNLGNCHADEGETKTAPDGKTLCNCVGLSPSSSACMSEIESDTSTSSVQRLSSSATHSANDSTSCTPLQSDKPEKTFSATEGWMPMLRKEAEFVAHSTWREKVVCEFGDDDEGKIIDLQGRPNDNASTCSAQAHNENDNSFHQWEWVLQLASLVTGVRYSDFKTEHENIHWLFTEEEIENIKKLPYFASIDNHESCIANRLSSRCFEVGGNTFLRDREDRVLIGIDHAELGFGSIAAHGHADALSFQMLVDGEVVFADPGTYIYHCDLPARNAFRKTINHNTLCLINENENQNENRFIDQSKMLGAFMWGDRAVCTLEKWASDEEKDILIASHDGYKPIVHRRQFEWDKVGRRLTITDSLSEEAASVITFMLGSSIEVDINDNHNENHNCILLKGRSANVELQFDGVNEIRIEDAELSPEYGVKVKTKAVRAYCSKGEVRTVIAIRLG